MTGLYRGYSTVVNQGIETGLYDINLVKQDLLNHFNTRLDERVGRPRYGTIIWDLLFDINDIRTESLIIADAERIINSDPRAQKLQISTNIDYDAGSIRLDILLLFVEFNIQDWFSVTFNPNN